MHSTDRGICDAHARRSASDGAGHAFGAALTAGYGLREHSTDAMGAAYAGAAASWGDASYMAYNPAALAGVENGDMSVGVIALLPDSSSSYPTAMTSAGTPAGGNPHPDDFVNDAYVPEFAFRQRLSERWAVGVSVNAPWGLRTQYPGDWAGRYYALKTRLEILDRHAGAVVSGDAGLRAGRRPDRAIRQGHAVQRDRFRHHRRALFDSGLGARRHGRPRRGAQRRRLELGVRRRCHVASERGHHVRPVVPFGGDPRSVGAAAFYL